MTDYKKIYEINKDAYMNFYKIDDLVYVITLNNNSIKFRLNLDEWSKITNDGHFNCGIFISQLYPDYIVKCNESPIVDITHVININEKIQLFPQIINVSEVYYGLSTHSLKYITMEKLDGDITKLFFTLIPQMILNKMIDAKEISEDQKQNILYLFNGKIHHTLPSEADNIIIQYQEISPFLSKIEFNCIYDPDTFTEYKQYLKSMPKRLEYNYEFTIKGVHYTERYLSTIEEIEDKKNKIDKLKSIQNISFDMYNSFMSNVYEIIRMYYPIIMKEIAKISYELIKMGYEYRDTKFDNFGFKLSISHIEKLRHYMSPKILDKYFYVYFLDWDSGLKQIEPPDTPDHMIYKLIDDFNYSDIRYLVNGDNKLRDLNIKLPITKYSDIKIDLLDINTDIIKILQFDYIFDPLSFNYKFKSSSDFLDFIYDTYR